MNGLLSYPGFNGNGSQPSIASSAQAGEGPGFWSQVGSGLLDIVRSPLAAEALRTFSPILTSQLGGRAFQTPGIAGPVPPPVRVLPGGGAVVPRNGVAPLLPPSAPVEAQMAGLPVATLGRAAAGLIAGGGARLLGRFASFLKGPIGRSVLVSAGVEAAFGLFEQLWQAGAIKKPRRMNPLNFRALKRAERRTCAFQRIARKYCMPMRRSRGSCKKRKCK